MTEGSLGEGFVADPIFEAQKVWKSADLTMKEVAEAGILLPDFVEALASATPNEVPLDRKPYEHQLKAWEIAAKGQRSYMVTSGTGSGKTECFMVPMINDLLKQTQGDQSLKGVHAIALYPLNALIESQRERLSAWVAPFKNQLSYALYNGDMPEEPNPRHRPMPGQINNRKELRSKVPPILVTNVTMLEYLLLRPQDRPILEASKGKLKWIILDEAHSYVGAQAAEMALMLRRVREAFGVNPEDVRLVATSATIGEGEETRNQLRRYLADLAGVSEDLVDVIEGAEIRPDLPSPQCLGALVQEELASLDEGALYNRIAADETVQKLVDAVRDGGKNLTQVADIVKFDSESPSRRTQAFEMLSTVARAKDPATGLRLLPWRMHAFHRAQGGLWVCCDSSCRARSPELAAKTSDWPWGQIHIFQRDHCDCGAAVFELMACHDCGASHLVAQETLGASLSLRQPVRAEVDDYAPDQEDSSTEDDEIEVSGDIVLLSPVDKASSTRWMDRKTSVISDSSHETDGMIKVAVRDLKPSPCCGARNGPSRIRYGAPFLLGNALPLLLESLPPPKGGLTSPSEVAVHFHLRIADKARQGWLQNFNKRLKEL
ncbi:hypothetical protein RC74_17540 [Falsihalocynthiibacter arcticus]|uniref:Helicase ATP-binding domain-containing protein n=2 Tax=Falsihalocynthiibacter arcticus TaxID=1579316 RepID=A0A126V3E9_9RHOB|nr:hypothetical protein RC74_17540 [Falsihalocynthiibacter arcticus]